VDSAVADAGVDALAAKSSQPASLSPRDIKAAVCR
jgi:hypothetical protein